MVSAKVYSLTLKGRQSLTCLSMVKKLKSNSVLPDCSLKNTCKLAQTKLAWLSLTTMRQMARAYTLASTLLIKINTSTQNSNLTTVTECSLSLISQTSKLHGSSMRWHLPIGESFQMRKRQANLIKLKVPLTKTLRELPRSSKKNSTLTSSFIVSRRLSDTRLTCMRLLLVPIRPCLKANQALLT